MLRKFSQIITFQVWIQDLIGRDIFMYLFILSQNCNKNKCHNSFFIAEMGFQNLLVVQEGYKMYLLFLDCSIKKKSLLH